MEVPLRPRLIAATLALAALGATAAPALAAIPGARAVYRCADMRPSWAFDGKFGPNTEAAVKAYQRAKGLKADGVAGMDTAWALKTTYRQPLKCGMVGPDVLELQRALSRAGFWGPSVAGAIPVPPEVVETPPERPVIPPMPEPTLPPIAEEPPMPTPVPVITPEPTPEPVVEEDIDLEDIPPDFVVEAPARSPWFDLRLGTWLVPISGSWFVPSVAGAPAPSLDFSVVRQNVFVDTSLFVHPNWGVGAGLQLFDLAGTAFDLGPFSQAGVMMIDGHLAYRFLGHSQLQAGYRGLSPGGPSPQNFAKLGLLLEGPLGVEWLWGHAGLTGGSNFGTDFFYDGRFGLGLKAGPVGLDVGFRHLGMQIGTQAPVTINGPTVGAKLQF